MKLLLSLLTITVMSSCSLQNRMDDSNELLKEATKQMRETKEQMIQANEKLDQANKNIKTASELLLSVVPTMNQINERIQTVGGQLTLLSTDLSDLAVLARTFNDYSKRGEFTHVIETLLSKENGFVPLFKNASELLEKMNHCTVEVFRPEYLSRNKEEAIQTLIDDYHFEGDLVWDDRGYFLIPKSLRNTIPLDQKELITTKNSFCEMVTSTALLNATRSVMHLGELLIDSGMAEQVEIPNINLIDDSQDRSSLFETINKNNIEKKFIIPRSQSEKEKIIAQIEETDERIRQQWHDFASCELDSEFKYGSEDADRLIFTHYQAEIAVYKVALSNNNVQSRRDYLISQLKSYLPYTKMMMMASDKQMLKSIDKLVLPKIKVDLKHPFSFTSLNMQKGQRDLVKTLRSALKYYYNDIDKSAEDFELRQKHLYALVADLFYYYYDTEYTLHLLSLSDKQNVEEEKEETKEEEVDEEKEEKGFWQNLFGYQKSLNGRSIASLKKKLLFIK